jgi:hypothetical protein
MCRRCHRAQPTPRARDVDIIRAARPLASPAQVAKLAEAERAKRAAGAGAAAKALAYPAAD